MVEITFNGETLPGSAASRRGSRPCGCAHALPFAFRVLTGFPPRYLMRDHDQDYSLTLGGSTKGDRNMPLSRSWVHTERCCWAT